MKKILPVALCVALFMFAFSACSGNSDNSKDIRIAELESQLEEMQAQLNETQSKLDNALSAIEQFNNSSAEIADNTTTSDESTDVTEPKSISVGETIILDFAEFSIESIEWLDKILPPDTSRTYSYIVEKENETFLVLHGKIKNLSGESFRINYMVSEFLFNEKYRYSGHTEGVSDDRRGFSGDTVKPLKDREFILYVSVPDEMKESYNDCVLTFGFDDSFNNRSNAKMDELKYQYSMLLQ